MWTSTSPTRKQVPAASERRLREIADKIPAAGPSIADLSCLNAHIATLVTHIKMEDKRLGAFLKK